MEEYMVGHIFHPCRLCYVMLNHYLQLILGTIRLMQLMEELVVKVICH
jgi:hypothetical protein